MPLVDLRSTIHIMFECAIMGSRAHAPVETPANTIKNKHKLQFLAPGSFDRNRQANKNRRKKRSNSPSLVPHSLLQTNKKIITGEIFHAVRPNFHDGERGRTEGTLYVPALIEGRMCPVRKRMLGGDGNMYARYQHQARPNFIVSTPNTQYFSPQHTYLLFALQYCHIPTSHNCLSSYFFDSAVLLLLEHLLAERKLYA